MSPESLIDIFREVLFIVIMGVCMVVLPGLLVGLVVALFQAITQINEMTISFLPKLVAILTTIAILSPWLLQRLVSFTQKLIMDIPYIIG